MAATKKEKNDNRAAYVRTATLNDLVRNIACSRSYAMALKSGNTYKILCEGEHIGECRIIYYFESKTIARYLVYSADEENGETMEMVDDVTKRTDHYKSQRIPIIVIAKDPYSPQEKNDLKGLSLIEAKTPDSIIRALLSEMDEDEQPKVYSFMVGKDRIIGSFALTKHDTFLYSKVTSKEQFPVISYDSVSDTAEPTKSFAGTSKLHIRIINLAEKPAFFKA